MKSKAKVTVFVVLITILIVVVWILNYLSNRVPDNPAGTIGNTAGNLNNGGYFCESDGIVYFANAYDDGTLYCMNADETEIKKLNRSEVSGLNAAGNYLYYYQKNSSAHPDFSFLIRTYGLYRCKKNGKKLYCLERTDCGTVSLIDNTVYYTKPVDGAQTLQLFSIGTDKKNSKLVADYLMNPANVSGGVIYYNGTVENHHLLSYDTATGQENIVKEYDMWNPTLQGQSIYFMDLEGDFRLCRYDMIDDSITVLTSDKVEAFNLSSQYIYYQTFDTDSPALWRMELDGSNPEIVAEGTYSDISVTSQYVYFHSYATEVPMYHTPANGPVAVSTFDGASQAAFEEMSK